MARVRFALIAGLCVIAMPLTGKLALWFAAPIRWFPDYETRAIVGFALSLFIVALYLLSMTTLLVSTARRLKHAGVTRWLTPLSLGADFVLWTPHLLDPSSWSARPLVMAVTVFMAAWVGFLVLAPGRTPRRAAQVEAAEFG